MRLNCGIPVENLSDEHLFAESRELKMLPSLYKRIGITKSKIPQKFTLGKGHMLFFYLKHNYTLSRYKLVLNECIKRGIKVKDESWRWEVYEGIKDNWIEEGFEKELLIERIIEKTKSSPKKYFHYNHKRISKDELINILIR